MADVRVVIKLHSSAVDTIGRRVHVGAVKVGCSKMPTHEIQSTALQHFLPSTSSPPPTKKKKKEGRLFKGETFADDARAQKYLAIAEVLFTK